MKKLLQSKRRGSAIPLVMVAIMILLAMGVGLLSLGFNGRIYSMRTASDIKARCAADAGLEMALFEMNEKLKVPWNEGTLPQEIDFELLSSDQVCSYSVTGNLGSYVITSLGQSGQAQRAVRATIGLKGAFDNAILTKGDLVLKSGTTVDGYNSGTGSTDVKVSIGSMGVVNDSITLNSGVVIEGDVLAAGDLDLAIKDLGATITGGKYISPPIALPEVSSPVLLDIGTDISAKGATVTITEADNGVYTAIDLKATGVPGILEIIGGGDVVLHVTGDIDLGNSCEIVVKDGSTLKIYVDGDIVCANGSSMNTEAPPEEAATLQIYATGEGIQDFDIKAKSEFTGVIYAPNADVVLYANGDAYGSIVADTFDFKSGGDFHYDEALRDNVSVDDEAVQFVVTRWHESPPMLSSDIKLVDVAPMLEAELVK